MKISGILAALLVAAPSMCLSDEIEIIVEGDVSIDVENSALQIFPRLDIAVCPEPQNPFVIFSAAPLNAGIDNELLARAEALESGRVFLRLCISLVCDSSQYECGPSDGIISGAFIAAHILDDFVDASVSSNRNLDLIWPIGSHSFAQRGSIEKDLVIDLSRLGTRAALIGGTMSAFTIDYSLGSTSKTLGPFRQGIPFDLLSCEENPNGFLNVKSKSLGCPK